MMRVPPTAKIVAIAALPAILLTAVRQSPEGVMSLGLDAQEVRAAPGTANSQHDLSVLRLFTATLVRVRERYVDPSRIDPKKMLFAALDGVQLNIPEVLVEPDLAGNQVTVTINDKKEKFDTDDVDSPWRLQGKLKRIFRFIEANMNRGADLAKVEYAAVNGMLSTLDPHSVLMDPEAARDMDVSTSGKFGGLGIVIRTIDHKLTVVKPMKGTPAWRSGIKAGDHIVKINNQPTENLTSNEAVERMRGDPRTAVTLWIARPNIKNVLRFDLMRDEIRVSQVEHKLLDRGVGYIRVKQFSRGIASDVGAAMREMLTHGATAWILDLRGNPGGLLEEAVRLADLFVDSGTLVTTVSGRDREARRAVRGFGDTRSSLAVLVNGSSASASEIVAGALKNLDRATIIGTQTFGKGSVQEIYDNDDRSKLKLTIAQYLTPGDRSIQNLGIIPDIQLQRMYVPEQNKAATDFVRMLAPTRSYGEKDLDAHLVSSYAKAGDRPVFEVPFLVERKKSTQAANRNQDDDPDPTSPPEEDEAFDDVDEIVEDWEMRFAKDVVATAASPTRSTMLGAAAKVVANARAIEERKLMAALAAIGVDWSGPSITPASPGCAALPPRECGGRSTATGANLEVALSTSAPLIKAGDEIAVTATVRNVGTQTAYRVLPRIQSEDRAFDDVELPIGKVAPGETKAFTTRVKVPQDALDRVDRVGLEVREAKNAPSKVAPAQIHIQAAARPVFAYAWQLVDNSNGDGLVQRGERFDLRVSIKNTGAGPSTPDAQAVLRNASGDGVDLDKSRFNIGALQPGQVAQFAFPLATTAALRGDELVLELMAYDANLDVQSSDKLHFKISPAVVGQARGSNVAMKAPAIIRSGNSTPPRIDLAATNLETAANSVSLHGSVRDETHIEDMYIVVSNPSAKIEGRKVYYRSNRGARDSKTLDFAAGIPLWSGSNMVTIIARENTDVRSVKTIYVYRDPAQTAQADPSATP